MGALFIAERYRPGLEVCEKPFVVLSLQKGEFPESFNELQQQEELQYQLYSAIQRLTGNYNRPLVSCDNRWFVGEARERDLNEVSGWRLGAKHGTVICIAVNEPYEIAWRRRLCHHRNVTKIIGFFRFFHSLIEVADKQMSEEALPRDFLQHSLNIVDQMRNRYSELWIRWAIQRLNLEESIRSLTRKLQLIRKYPSNKPEPRMENDCDFLILTPLAQERDSVLKYLEGTKKAKVDSKFKHVSYLGEVKTTFPDDTTATYKVAIVPLIDMGRAEAATATVQGLERWRPRYVILVGIAGGFRNAGVSLGDILIANQIADYEEQKLRDNASTIRWQTFRVDAGLLAQAQNLSGEWASQIAEPRPVEGRPCVQFGVICSGDKVIANDLLEKFHDTWSRLIGVEMEAGGVARAVAESGNCQGFFMIRSVSDLADGNKDSTEVKSWRNYACEAAASYLFAFLKSGPVSPSTTMVSVSAVNTIAAVIMTTMPVESQVGKSFQFVHVSDIHIGQGRLGELDLHDDVRNQILVDCNALKQELGSADGIFINGDVAYSGTAEQYAQAITWVKAMADCVGCSLETGVHVIPGNHDIDREKIDYICNLTHEKLRAVTLEELDREFDKISKSAEATNMLLSKLKGYRDFAKAYGCDFSPVERVSWQRRISFDSNYHLMLVGLTSVVVSDANDAKDKMILGRRQYILNNSEDVEMIVMVHHPLSWFKDQQAAQPYLDRARMFLMGHEHILRIAKEQLDSGQEFLKIFAGATNPPESGGAYQYRYNWIKISLRAREGTPFIRVEIYPRVWESGQAKFVADWNRLRGNKVTTIDLSCPNFRKLEPGL